MRLDYLEKLSNNTLSILITLACMVAMHIFASPAYFALSPACKPCPECCNMQEKIDRKDFLLQSVSDKYHPATHMAKQEFRLTPPLLFKLFNISGKYGAYILQVILGFGFIFMAHRLILLTVENKILSAFLTLALSFTYVGYAFVAEMEGFFDTFAYFFLMLCLMEVPLWVIGMSSFLAFYTDERAILSAFLVIFWWQIKQGYSTYKPIYVPTKQSIVILLGIISYLATRWILIEYFGFKNQFSGTNSFAYTIPYMGMSFWQMFEGFWLLLLLAVYALFKHKKYVTLVFFSGIVFFIFITSHAVMDITRSVAYNFPAIFIALYILKKICREDIKNWVLACLIVCFIFPAQSIIASKPIHFYKPIYIRIAEKVVRNE